MSKEGYIARIEKTEVLVAMNKSSILEDIQNLELGGICLYPNDIQLPLTRGDVTLYLMPVNDLVQESGAEAKLKPYVANMVYVGVLASLLNIDLNEIEAALTYTLNGKEKAVTLNDATVKIAYDWTVSNLAKSDPFCCQSHLCFEFGSPFRSHVCHQNCLYNCLHNYEQTKLKYLSEKP